MTRKKLAKTTQEFDRRFDEGEDIHNLVDMSKAKVIRYGKKAVKAKSKRKPNPEFMKPMKISDALSRIVGSKPIPRTEVTKKLWQYIKKNRLQDTFNKRNINADANLKTVFGGKKTVSMFEMTKMVSKHLS